MPPTRYMDVQDVIDEVERFIWSFPNVHVLSTTRSWMETD